MTILPKGEILGGVQSGQLEMATLGLFFVATCGMSQYGAQGPPLLNKTLNKNEAFSRLRPI